MEINDPAELEDIFDAITYAKADSVIRMLCNYLGEETFQAGMRSYLRQYQYSNATTVDLWKAFGDASGTVSPSSCGTSWISLVEEMTGTARCGPAQGGVRSDLSSEQGRACATETEVRPKAGGDARSMTWFAAQSRLGDSEVRSGRALLWTKNEPC